MSYKPMPSDRKVTYRDLQHIWDGTKQKLAVMVVGCSSEVSQGGAPSLYCSLKWGKQKQTTSVQKKTQQPVWNEYFLFAVETSFDLTIELYKTKKLGSDVPFGHATIFRSSQWRGDGPEEEEVVDLWLDLESRGKKEKAAGKIHVRYVYSTSPETRPVHEKGQQIFFYDDYIDRFKTGDLIAYSGIGFLHSINKLSSNSNYSHVGVVFRLPNKWTKREDLYILEISRNTDKFLDAFVEKPISGVCLFRFFERVHQFHGTKIWWVPLKNAIPQNQAMMDYMWEVHGQREFLNKQMLREFQQKRVDPAMLTLLECYGHFGKSSSQKAEFIDLLDAKFTTTLLKRGGLEVKKQSVRYPGDIVSLPSFGEPILLRDVDFSVNPQTNAAIPQQYYAHDQGAEDVNGESSQDATTPLSPPQGFHQPPLAQQQPQQPQQPYPLAASNGPYGVPPQGFLPQQGYPPQGYMPPGYHPQQHPYYPPQAGGYPMAYPPQAAMYPPQQQGYAPHAAGPHAPPQDSGTHGDGSQRRPSGSNGSALQVPPSGEKPRRAHSHDEFSASSAFNPELDRAASLDEEQQRQFAEGKRSLPPMQKAGAGAVQVLPQVSHSAEQVEEKGFLSSSDDSDYASD
ncbi:rhodopsin [Balamuthia mandrillaris]